MKRNLTRTLVLWLCGCWLGTGLMALPAAKSNLHNDVKKKIDALENGIFPFNPVPQDAGSPAPKPATLAERMAAYHVPGVSLAVIHNNRIEWAKGYGTTKAGGDVPVEPRVFFQAASTTKSLVAATVLHFVEKGTFDLDVDVNTYLKSWKIPENEFIREKKVTLRLLLSHRAGMPSTNMGYDDNAGIPSLLQVVKGERPAQNRAAVPESVPGSGWNYSNVGYVLIQLILEDTLQKPLNRIMVETLFQPLKMQDTTLFYPLPPLFADREALPHDKDGTLQDPAMHPTALAQGGLMTTPTALARFTIALMQSYKGKPGSILSSDSAKSMFHAEAELDPRMFGTPLSYGLGFFIKGSSSNLIVSHPGNNFPGSICWLTGFPEQGNGVVVMVNGANGEMLVLEILAALGRIYQWPPLSDYK